MYYNFLRTFVPCKKYSQQYIICIWRKMSAKSSKQNVRTLVKKNTFVGANLVGSWIGDRHEIVNNPQIAAA